MGSFFLFEKFLSTSFLRQDGSKYPPVIGVAISESFGKWIAGDLQLGYLKQAIQAC